MRCSSKLTEVQRLRQERKGFYRLVLWRLNSGDILCRLRASVEGSSGTRVQVGTSVLAAITCLQSDLPTAQTEQLQPILDLMAAEENTNREENYVAQDQR